jgi:hypothetical protein|tara:strand:- start:1727 stop:1888 length:162 start_codon:yes stop_codon:yes gene_type:complete
MQIVPFIVKKALLDQIKFINISEHVSSIINSCYDSLKISGDSHANEQGADIIA